MNHTPHLRDDELLLALDGRRLGEVDEQAQVHLAECAACRHRLQEFADTDLSVEQTESSDSDWTERTLRGRARARLQAELAGAAHVERFATSLGWEGGPTTRPNRAITATLAVAIVALAVAGVASWRTRSNVAPPTLTASTQEPDALPNRSLTPGATRALPVAELCGKIPWEPSPVPPSVRQEVLRNYRMEHVPDHEYELDYLVTPDLGGSPDSKNLWPERYGSRVWNARVKDQLEDLLPHLVCQGEVDLATAQRDIATDWIAAYKKYFRTNRPIGLSTRAFVESSANQANN